MQKHRETILKALDPATKNELMSFVPPDPPSTQPSEPVFINPLSTPESRERYTWDDRGNGYLFADMYKNTFRYCPEAGEWYRYNGKIWKIDPKGLTVREHAKKLTVHLLKLALEYDREKGPFLKNVLKLAENKTREAMLRDAQTVYPLSVSVLDKNPELFNCQNGTLNLNTFEFLPHSPDDLLGMISGVIYDPDAQNRRWEEFISEIMEGSMDKSSYLQIAAGYSLLGVPKEECLFILYGSKTRNGKSTMINALMSCLGDYGKTINQSTVEERNNANSGGPSEDLARLKSARLVNVPEPKEGLRMDEAKVKNMTGRDIITARFLHQNSFEFSPQFVLWIDTNHAPVIKDLTLFESRRIRIIPFDRHFSDEEQDQDLKDEFARPEALSGIFNWILSGLWLYHEIGLSEPLAVKEAIKKYRQENDKIGQFVEEYFETAGPNDAIRTKDAYERYRRWCSDNGYKTESIKKFSGKISSAGYVIKVGRYQGSIQLSHIWGIKISSH